MCAEVNVSREFHCREGLGAVHTISIQNVFEQRAAQCPDSTAIISPLGDWSYTRLRSYANHVATRLRKEGVRPGSLVGVCAASTPETIGVFLGILKAGAAYLPLATSYPEERIRYMLSDANPDVIIADNSGLDKLAGVKSGAILINIQHLEGGVETAPEVNSQWSPASRPHILPPATLAGRPPF